MDRILYPASKREAASGRLNYYGLNSEFDLPDIYRTLNQFDLVFYDLQLFISGRVAKLFGRDRLSGEYVRLLDVGVKIKYEEIPDRKSRKLVPGLKFSREDQVAQDYCCIQETFGTDFYYAYAKQEDFKRFFKEMELGKRA